MASFLDNPNVQFSNYINPIDVQAYGAAIMQKQQQYDQGVQKVHGIISSVAGLEVYRDTDKQYLQNKVGSLSSSLNELAGADWSNPHLINQVGAYASQIAGDKQIQNAVASTQRIKKGYSEMEDAQKKGELHSENKIYFEDQIAAYAASTDPNQTFNGSYTPYTDVMGTFLKNYNAAHPDEMLTQDAFSVDANGQMQLNMASKEVSDKGIDPTKVNAIWQATLMDGGVQNQLRINAHSTYRGITGEQLMSTIKENYARTSKDFNDKIADLRTKQAIDKNQSSQATTEQIAALERQGNVLLEQLNNSERVFQQGGDEALKTHIYKADTARNLMNAFSYGQHSEKYVKSELLAGKYEQLNYELKLQQEQTDNAHWSAEFAQKERLAHLAAETSLAKKKGGSGGEGGEGEDDGLGGKGLDIFYTDVAVSDEQGKVGRKDFMDNITSLKQQENQISSKYINMLANTTGRPSPVKQLANGSWGWNLDPTGKNGYRTPQEAQAARNGIYTQLKLSYDQGNPEGLVRTFFNEYNEVLRNLKHHQIVSDRIEKQYGGNPVAMEKAYKDAQQTFVPKEATLITSTPAARQKIQQAVRAIGDTFATGSGDHATSRVFREAIAKDTDKDKPFSYHVQRNPKTNDYTLIVREFDGSEKARQKITDRQAAQLGVASTQDEFWTKYGPTLSLTGKTTTDVNYDGSVGKGGVTGCWEVPSRYNSKYRTRYHITGNGDDGYMLKLWVNDNQTGKSLVDGKTYDFNLGWMNHDQFMKAVNALQDDNVVTGVLQQFNPR